MCKAVDAGARQDGRRRPHDTHIFAAVKRKKASRCLSLHLDPIYLEGYGLGFRPMGGSLLCSLRVQRRGTKSLR